MWGQFAGMILSSEKCSKNILTDKDKSVYSEDFHKKVSPQVNGTETGPDRSM